MVRSQRDPGVGDRGDPYPSALRRMRRGVLFRECRRYAGGAFRAVLPRHALPAGQAGTSKHDASWLRSSEKRSLTQRCSMTGMGRDLSLAKREGLSAIRMQQTLIAASPVTGSGTHESLGWRASVTGLGRFPILSLTSGAAWQCGQHRRWRGGRILEICDEILLGTTLVLGGRRAQHCPSSHSKRVSNSRCGSMGLAR